MVTRAFAAGVAVAFLAGPAFAQQLPNWSIADICRDDSAPGQCRIFEAGARNTISATWDVLPTDVRSACTAATRAPADQSWRILASCIDGEVLRARAERAIATRSTPAEPEPPQPPAPAEPAAAAEAPPTAAEPATQEQSAMPVTPNQPAAESAPTAPPSSAGQQ